MSHAACGQADDRRLIALVRARPLLFGRSKMPVASYYEQVRRLWVEVAAEMGWTVADARRKWSHLRNSYSRHLRNELQGACTSKGRMVSKWYLADELDFLREHMATDTGSASHPTFATSLLDLDMSDSVSSEHLDVKPFMSASAPRQDCSTSLTFAPDENSSFFQYFRGLYTEYEGLTPRNQRKFKRQCLTFLHQLHDQQEEEGTAPGGRGQVCDPSGSDDERDLKPIIEIGPVQIR
ncbi:uncharacterized protein LOC126965329 [Leptidea sinapis]|uniref:uncharacterized protein LOC126965329 n=1 Tax=Leptidea sinapis TaxID=189913 RepID=UPI00213BB80E|nr:uncharacterized protein LOC126965329 [Leptidea sinapis]